MNQSNSMSIPSQLNNIIRRVSVRYGGAKPRELERLIKFLIVGAVGAVIDLGVTNFLVNFVFHIHEDAILPGVLAASIGFTLAVISNFIWNRYWTYPDSRSRRLRDQLAQFFLISFVGLGIRAVVVGTLSMFFASLVGELVHMQLLPITIDGTTQVKLGFNMAVMLALVIVAGWNFVANRYWTYNDIE